MVKVAELSVNLIFFLALFISIQQMSKLGFEGYNLLENLTQTHQPPQLGPPKLEAIYNLQKPTKTPQNLGRFLV